MSRSPSHRDIQAVQANWKEICLDVTGLGCDAFKELFAVNPSYVNLFSGVARHGELTVSNSKMREHAIRVFSALGSWINALPDKPVLAGLLEHEGQSHYKRSVGETHFNNLRPALYAALEKRLGARFNRIAWDRVYSAFIEGLAIGWSNPHGRAVHLFD